MEANFFLKRGKFFRIQGSVKVTSGGLYSEEGGRRFLWNVFSSEYNAVLKSLQVTSARKMEAEVPSEIP
jgi:hypothetical protein